MGCQSQEAQIAPHLETKSLTSPRVRKTFNEVIFDESMLFRMISKISRTGRNEASSPKVYCFLALGSSFKSARLIVLQQEATWYDLGYPISGGYIRPLVFALLFLGTLPAHRALAFRWELPFWQCFWADPTGFFEFSDRPSELRHEYLEMSSQTECGFGASWAHKQSDHF